LSSQPTFVQARAQAQLTGDPVAGQALYAVCSACHGPQGQGNHAMNAPKLSGQEGAYLRRQLQYFKHGIRGALEQDVYGKQMAPMAMTLADDAAISNVVAYIETLPDQPAITTVVGNVDRGKRLYVTCSVCHGADGGGKAVQGTPRIAGLSDWYLVTQLQHFKQGIRGAHADDAYGAQMRLMAGVLVDDQAVNDMVAYLNNL
jgi:cytochrome c oxidase subunit II